MGRWKALLYVIGFFFVLGFLNRSPRLARHPLLRRLNLAIDLMFWGLLILYSGILLYWILTR